MLPITAAMITRAADGRCGTAVGSATETLVIGYPKEEACAWLRRTFGCG
jgi:hypothetical protein